MDAKKALLLGAILSHLSVLVHGAKYSVFASMTPNASDTFPQVDIFLKSPNNVYYLYMGITSTAGEGMQCYLAEANVQTAELVQKWGGVTMLGDYSASDVCSLVLDDGGYIAVETYGYYLNIYNLTSYQIAHMADVKIYLYNNGTLLVSATGSTTPSASSPPPPASSTPSPSASSTPPPSTPSPSASSTPPPPASHSSPPPPSSRTGIFQSSASPLSKFYLPSILFSLLLLCHIAF